MKEPCPICGVADNRERISSDHATDAGCHSSLRECVTALQERWADAHNVLRKAVLDLHDCIEAWKYHCRHIERGTPCAVKTIGTDFFDPRGHCDLCAAEWKRRREP